MFFDITSQRERSRSTRHAAGRIETAEYDARTAAFRSKTVNIVHADQERRVVNDALKIERVRVRRPLSRTLC
jgi:hypothetical protein